MNRIFIRLSSIIMLCIGVSFSQKPDAKTDSPSNQTSGQRSDQASSALFASTCAVCHGSDGRGGERGPNIATDREMVRLSDSQLHDILNKGVLASGMPAFGFLGEDKIKALVQYLRDLQGIAGTGQAQLPGDPRAGEQLFFGAASCSSCHMINGRGGILGEDLTAYARGRSAEALRAAIVHPGEAGHLIEVVTSRSATYKGIIRAGDNFNIVLQSEDGAFHSIARNDISQMTISRQPLMPIDYASKLQSKQLDDLISYLIKSSGTGKAVPAKGNNDE
jgi:cytochrome c oxidase cbb3-type subunit III